jgi:hypothetical protein
MEINSAIIEGEKGELVGTNTPLVVAAFFPNPQTGHLAWSRFGKSFCEGKLPHYWTNPESFGMTERFGGQAG